MELAEMNSFNAFFTNQTETNIETLSNVEFFDEQHYANHNFVVINSSSDEEDIENLHLKVTLSQTFQTWNDAEKYLNDYALEKGFSIRRKRTENQMEDGNKILRKISWECCCA
ncbi:9185_t:CDS:1, partial [Funneliformis caledonium]